MTKNQPTLNEATQLMDQLTSEEVDELVELCVCTPMEGYPGDPECLWGVPVLIEGIPGTAKTARTKQFARTVHVKAKSLFAAQHPPEDFSGALIPDGKGDARQICPLQQVRELIEIGTGIIFLDELNGAPPATQGAIQSFVHERVAGDQPIPGKIRMVAAQNPEEIATGGHRLSAGLANRFVHIKDPGVSGRRWIQFMTGGAERSTFKPTLAAAEKIIQEDWPSMYPTAVGLFAGFIDKHPQLISDMPDENSPQISRAWPSSRTWDYATRLWTTSLIMEKSDNVRNAAVICSVGEGAGSVFLQYARVSRIPHPTQVLEGKWTIDPNRLDVVLAAYIGAVTHVIQLPTQADKIKAAPKIWRALKPLIDHKLADIVMISAESLVQAGLSARPTKNEEIKSASQPILAYLANSGLDRFTNL